MNKKHYLAHVRQEGPYWELHFLEDHLRKVARRCGEFSLSFGEQSLCWARLAGLFHDFGKYSADFQKMIASRSGYNPEAHLEGESMAGKVNHSSAGALHACQLKPLQGIAGKMLSYLIAGHHAGLPDWYGKLDGRLENTRANEALYQAALAAEIPGDILNPEAWMRELTLPDFLNPKKEGYQAISVSFWLRMLFSCLVDADFLDTEAFMDGKKAGERSVFPSLAELKPCFDQYMETFKNSLPTPVNRLRQRVLEACVAKASLSTGIYTLTVPTGGGKTLTGLAYALQHALQHGKDRIIYVLPFTSILEQTAAVFRAALNTAGRIDYSL